MMVSSRPHPGCFIVLEGIDGCGSTTQSKILVERLRASGHDARWTCEPSEGPVGQLIRLALQGGLAGSISGTPREFDWAALALLFAADRLDHVKSSILPALFEGAVVVSDRYTLSSLVYQSVTAPEVSDSIAWISALNRYALDPDITIVIELPVELAAARRRQRGGPEELFDAESTQARLAEAYARAETLCPETRIVRVPGTGQVEEVAERILSSALVALPGLAGSGAAI